MTLQYGGMKAYIPTSGVHWMHNGSPQGCTLMAVLRSAPTASRSSGPEAFYRRERLAAIAGTPTPTP